MCNIFIYSVTMSCYSCENWKDDVAVNVILHTKRLKILNQIDVHRDSFIMSFFMDILNKFEIDYICSASLPSARTKRFIETLCMKMTTDLFITFLMSLDDHPQLRKEIHEAYMSQ